jgi:hypothetical protein
LHSIDWVERIGLRWRCPKGIHLEGIPPERIFCRGPFWFPALHLHYKHRVRESAKIGTKIFPIPGGTPRSESFSLKPVRAVRDSEFHALKSVYISIVTDPHPKSREFVRKSYKVSVRPYRWDSGQLDAA